ncbi:MAG: PAS domain-containing protein [Desulfobacterales bacterium]|nr:PAS domain-containing protein [Desulfobacterales bacterium]
MLKAMVEGATLPVIVIDGDGRIIFANKSSEEFTEYSRQELLGLNVRDLCAPYEPGRYIFSTLPEIKKTTEVDIDLRRKSGRVFMASVSFSPFDHRGSRRLLLTLRDVTTNRVQEGKTREAEERYRKLLDDRNMLQDQLNRSSKLAFMGELAAGIAHEINNPLGIILGFVQDILEEIPEDHPLAESIKIIEQETARCVGVVKELLDFARLRPPQRRRVDMLQLLEDSVALLMPGIKKNKVRIIKAYANGVPNIEIDPDLIRQVFLNVMINAIQAMPYGGELGLDIDLVRCRQSQQGQDYVRATISDTGRGIHEEDLDRVFDPFFTTKGTKGTGLGLSVCQRIMDDHRGRIEIESRRGVGTTCRIYSPV